MAATAPTQFARDSSRVGAAGGFSELTRSRTISSPRKVPYPSPMDMTGTGKVAPPKLQCGPACQCPRWVPRSGPIARALAPLFPQTAGRWSSSTEGSQQHRHRLVMAAISTTILAIDVLKHQSWCAVKKPRRIARHTSIGLRNLWAALGTGYFPLPPRRTKASTKLGCCEALCTRLGKYTKANRDSRVCDFTTAVCGGGTHSSCLRFCLIRPISLHLHLVGVTILPSTPYLSSVRCRLSCSLLKGMALRGIYRDSDRSAELGNLESVEEQVRRIMISGISSRPIVRPSYVEPWRVQSVPAFQAS
ncbi:hypothetical protein B0T14DRAFT_138535 [Immersiella caudata]|uniref:Uncharacterized protein n=1 Tax=Immersiella caudata TaxID=314043 RepID=A0AA39X5X6_9PEZI|nr:hypothetical protein B0T14DRAFT_138535 [Immersiella caudata]